MLPYIPTILPMESMMALRKIDHCWERFGTENCPHATVDNNVSDCVKPPLPVTPGVLSSLGRRVFMFPPKWESAYTKYNRLYLLDGTAAERWFADMDLLNTIRSYGWYYSPLAWLIWIITRVGGGPYWPFCWRWNCGWPWPQKLWYWEQESYEYWERFDEEQ